MRVTYISTELRRQVEARAEGICEYCLIHSTDTFVGHQVDHIVGEKHGGETEAGNLAFACVYCNRYKGSDVGSIIPGTARFVRFYNPRLDSWTAHFALAPDGITIESRTDVGEATARIFAFNSDNRLRERGALRQAGRYPADAAQTIINRDLP